MRTKGVGKMANVRYWYQTAAIKVYLPSNMAETEILQQKTRTKLKHKRTSIATVRDHYPTYATFPTPHVSHYRLTFKVVKI
jgi:hypothetical protein